MRTTSFQFQILVGYMERYGDISRLRRCPMSTEKLDRHWEKLTGLLNGDGGIGPLRNAKQWKKVWSDFKKSTRKKDRKMKIAHKGPYKSKKGVLDARVMAIINNDDIPLLDGSSETGDTDYELRPNKLSQHGDNCLTEEIQDSDDDTTSEDELVIDTKIDFSIQNYCVDNNKAHEKNRFVSNNSDSEHISAKRSKIEEVFRESSTVQNNKHNDINNIDNENVPKSDKTNEKKDATVENNDLNSVLKENLQNQSNVPKAGKSYESEAKTNLLNNWLEDIKQKPNEIKQPPIILSKHKTKHAARHLAQNNSPNNLINEILRAETQKYNAVNTKQSGAACSLLTNKDKKTKDTKSSVTEKSDQTPSLTPTVAIVSKYITPATFLTNTKDITTLPQNNRDRNNSHTSPSQQKDIITKVLPVDLSNNHSNDGLIQNEPVNTSKKHNVNASQQNYPSTSAANDGIISVTQNNEASINVNDNAGGGNNDRNRNKKGSKRRRSTIDPAAPTPNKRRSPYSIAPEAERDERQFQREVALLKLEIEKEEIRLKNKGFEIINRFLSFTEKFFQQRFHNTI